MYGVVPLKGRTVEVLSREEILQIHQAVLEVLKDPGVKIKHEEALDILGRAGAEIDQAKQVAHIPECLVERALNQAPRFMTVCGRDPKYDLKSGTGEVHFRSTQGSLFISDFDTGVVRRPTKKDLENLVRIQDALENTHLVQSEVVPQDVPLRALYQHINQGLLSNTEKPCVAQALDGKEARDLIKMGIAIAGSEEALRRRPTTITSVGVVSPLCLERDRVDVLFELCRFGLPIRVYSLPSAGGTAPVTLAGMLVLQTAEILAGVILGQLVRPGTAVMALGIGSIIDQKYAAFVHACPESALIAGATAQIFRYYGLPHGTYGAWTEAKTLDMQAGYEMGIQTLFFALSGADIVVGVPSGMGSSPQVSFYELPVIANELCGMVYRILRGIEVNPDTLAVNVIREVGPGGHFLAHRHTREHYRLENWEPKVSNRMSREEYQESGALDVLARAREEVKRILTTHQPKPLDIDVQKKLQQIVEEAED